MKRSNNYYFQKKKTYFCFLFLHLYIEKQTAFCVRSRNLTPDYSTNYLLKKKQLLYVSISRKLPDDFVNNNSKNCTWSHVELN